MGLKILKTVSGLARVRALEFLGQSNGEPEPRRAESERRTRLERKDGHRRNTDHDDEMHDNRQSTTTTTIDRIYI
jgi:hypothetical protein